MRIFLSVAALSLASLWALPSQAADTPSFDLTIKDHKFTPDTLTVPADTKVKLLVKNEDSAAEEFESSDLSREKVIAPHGQAVIMVGPLKAGTYKFVGEYHEATAKGQIIAK